MFKHVIKLLLSSALVLAIFAGSAHAQVVASGMTGTVLDTGGQPVAGATVTAVHLPTNTTFTAVSGPNGRFSFSGMPVGGPYRVSASAEGHQIAPLPDVQTSLGENVDVALTAKDEVLTLEKFVTTASQNDLDANATGASSVLSSRRIIAQPTVSRSFTDLIKTNPFVSVRAYPQVTALGMNNRYNSITLDGAQINDSFGLSSSGLFSAFNPFSLDAVEQFSISLTPYDVRQSGSAGAYINAVSKSGTNEFHGTIYDIFTDSNWQGPDKFGPNRNQRTPLKERTYGFTLGGPIIPDKLFFFVNWEKFIQDSSPTLPGFTPDPAFLDAVQDKVSSLPGSPDIGTFGGSSTSRKFDTKRLAKIDWNITDDHRLTVRYSDTASGQPNFGSFNYSGFSQPVTFTAQNNLFPSSGSGTGVSSAFYSLDITEKVWAAQLFSNWTPDLKTEFDYSNTKQDSCAPCRFPSPRSASSTFQATTTAAR
jgi:hypothetical protein